MAPDSSAPRLGGAAGVGLAILLAVVAVAIMFFVPSWLTGRAQSALEREAVGVATVTAGAVAPGLVGGDPEEVERIVAGVAEIPEIAYVVVHRAGATVASAPSAQAAASAGEPGIGARYGGDLLHVGALVPDTTPTAVVQVGYRLDDLRSQRTAHLLLGTAISLLLLLAALFAGLVTRPPGGATLSEEAPPEDTTTKVFSGDEFIAWLSHELRTPLSAILGYAEILEEDAIHLEQEDLVPDLKRIGRAGTHMLALVDDVVALQHVFAGHLELDITEFEVEDLLAEVEREVKSLINRTLTTLEIDRSPDVRKMTADRERLRRAVTNVVREAAGATGQGQLRLQVRKQPDEQGQVWLVFRITHPGLELSPHEITTMIKGFGEARSRALPRYHQTGLGLVISREFCRAQGGDLVIDSDAEGTVFEIRMPRVVST